MINKGDRCKTSIILEIFRDDRVFESQGNMHDHSALRVTDVVDHLVGMVMNILESSRQVIDSHFMERVVPEGVVLGSQTLVFQGVVIASHVA